MRLDRATRISALFLAHHREQWNARILRQSSSSALRHVSYELASFATFMKGSEHSSTIVSIFWLSFGLEEHLVKSDE